VKHPKATFAFRVTDDAMAPTIPEGSLVGVDCSVRDPERLHKSGAKLVAVRDIHQTCTVRQLVKAEEYWLFLASNPSDAAPPTVWSEHDGSECPIVGRVLFAVVVS